MTKLPRLSVNKFDITSNRSEVVLTGRKRRRGTLIPKKKKIYLDKTKKFRIDHYLVLLQNFVLLHHLLFLIE